MKSKRLLNAKTLASCLLTCMLMNTAQAGFLDQLAKELPKQQSAEEQKQQEAEESKTIGLDLLKEVTTTGTVDTTALVKKLVNKECRSQLNDRQEWKLISMLMSAEKKREWEDKVCDCATEETVKSAETSDIIKVANPSTRNETVVKITKKAVKACVARFAQ